MSEPIRDLVIIGAGGHAREVHQIVRDINAALPSWRVLGFAVEPGYRPVDRVHDLPVLLLDEFADCHPGAHVVVAVGTPGLRQRLVGRIESSGRHAFATLVHPRAIVGAGVRLGEGCVVFPGCVLTADLRLCRHVHVNTAASISHDCCVEDFATIGPRVCCCGGVFVGEAVDVGAGATLIPGVRIGARASIGAGAVVTADIPPGVTAVGMPARPARAAKEAS
jgi:sugar O-acyltransferase (sialic acid O-acetyltransferase NeuD family)